MLIYMAGFAGWLQISPGVASPPWRMYFKLTDLTDPGPGKTLLFWDQREDVINWGNFFIDMSGYPDQPNQTQFGSDMPASYHNGAGGLSFADGHAEIRRWRDPRTTPPVREGVQWFGGSSPRNQDIMWLQERATRKMK